jgi:Holliday junction resolvasome RuvABC endonuclease subunit
VSLVAGIDFSTFAVDVVLLDEDTMEATWRRYELEGHDPFERAKDVTRAYEDGLNAWDDVLAVGIEEPPYVNNHKTLRDLARVQGAILARLPRNLMVQEWAPSQWRKEVGLPGNASKELVSVYVTGERVLAEKKDDRWPQDAADAYCIALATMRKLERKEN